MNGHVRARGKRADGTTKWQARYADPTDPTGRNRIEKTFRTKQAAEKWLTQQQAAILQGEHSDPRRADRPFSDAVEAWRETRAGSLAPKTRDRYDDVLRLHLLPEFGRMPLSAMTREVMKRYFARLQREGRTAGREKPGQPLAPRQHPQDPDRAELGAVRGGRDGHPAGEPGRAHEAAGAGPQGHDRADGRRGPHAGRGDRAALPGADLHGRLHGLRAGELWGLRRMDVDLLRGVLHVRQTVKRDTAAPDADPATVDSYGREVGPPKNGKQRTISLPKHLRDMLNAHLTQPSPGGTGPDAMVFHTPAGRAVRHTLWMRVVFRPAVAAALPHKAKLRFHDLRHTCASLLIAAGAHAKLVQERLGHASITTTLNLYGHVLPSTEAALVDALDSVYEGAQGEAGVG